MRTSTIVFLILFLCLYSSRENKEKLGALAAKVRGAVCELTDGACERHGGSCAAAMESEEVRALRARLCDVEKRDKAAARTLRTVERSIRSLDDRIRKLQSEARSDPRFSETYERGLSLLIRQRDELAREQAEIEALKESLKSETIRLQAEIDLASIRAEREEVEAFLSRERGSPLEHLEETSFEPRSP